MKTLAVKDNYLTINIKKRKVMYLQFNAFIPGFLGMPLDMLVAFKNKLHLSNDVEFYDSLRSAGSRNGYRTWIPEPFGDDTFCGTDNRNFGGHNIALAKYGTSRLYIYPTKSLFHGIDLDYIGKMKEKYHGKVFEKQCDYSHRVSIAVALESHWQDFSSPSFRINSKNLISNMNCHYDYYSSYYGHVHEYQDERSNPNASWFIYPNRLLTWIKISR